MGNFKPCSFLYFKINCAASSAHVNMTAIWGNDYTDSHCHVSKKKKFFLIKKEQMIYGKNYPFWKITYCTTMIAAITDTDLHFPCVQSKVSLCRTASNASFVSHFLFFLVQCFLHRGAKIIMIKYMQWNSPVCGCVHCSGHANSQLLWWRCHKAETDTCTVQYSQTCI